MYSIVNRHFGSKSFFFHNTFISRTDNLIHTNQFLDTVGRPANDPGNGKHGCVQFLGDAQHKAAHQARNRDMVDRSDLVVFYVEHEHGGAWQTMSYAVNQEKEIINLATK